MTKSHAPLGFSVMTSLLVALALPVSASEDTLQLLKAMARHSERINDYTAIFHKQEVVKGKMLPQENIFLKFQKPFSVYMRWLEGPFEGQEVLYVRDKYKGKLIGHKGGFFGFVTILTEVQIPLPKSGSKGYYHKVRERQAWDHPIVSISTVVQTQGGICRDARVVLGGVAPIPWRAAKAEGFLRGKRVDENVTQRVGEIALEGARPLKDNMYKVGLAKSLIQRALLASA